MGEKGNVKKIEYNMCHQCQKSDRVVVRCQFCKRKRFCRPCLNTWYPSLAEENVAKKCPFCCNICNCRSCLRMDNKLEGITSDLEVSWDEKIQSSKYILRWLLPHLKEINDDQISEKEIEAKVLGLEFEEVKPQGEAVDCLPYDRLYCDICQTSIFDFYRSCSSCSYDICLTCCLELRSGKLQACQEDVSWNYINRGFEYAHGGRGKIVGTTNNKLNSKDRVNLPSMLKPKETGSISCYCGSGDLELKRILPNDWISDLIKNVEKAAEANKLLDSPETDMGRCPCFSTQGDINMANDKRLKAACRDGSEDNYLYYPSVGDVQQDDLKHFQHHWVKGEPVVVRNVLEVTPGLSWEPMVMWSACRQRSHAEYGTLVNVNAVDCLDFSERWINLHGFFKGYKEGRYDDMGWPQVLKLKDLDPSKSFKEILPRHYEEFLFSLPLKQYTHPSNGPLNLAVKFPRNCLKPNIGPKTYIAYGYAQEFGRGDSVTKLHYDMSDVVNVLTHISEVPITEGIKSNIEKLKHEHGKQDLKELFCSEANNVVKVKVPDNINEEVETFETDEGALWDIFRREDVPKLEKYLEKHHKEFRHMYCCPVSQVVHPIHDQTFYLTRYHKRMLKDEYGIEPWTFVQKLGDAVLVPVGCPYQIRNLKSCTNVGHGFVSPENVSECLRLAKEYRLLPPNHYSKEDDKLEVEKVILFAIDRACRNINSSEKGRVSTSSSYL